MPLQSEHKLIGESPAFLQVLDHVSSVAQLNKPVLVIGERGTGKELIASRLHYLSPRWEQEFLKINCAALPESLLETELFGHEAGAFTGATRQHLGRFERANGGSLFLDEIANMSMRVQEKLLRVIEYGEFERVGGDKTIETDVRIIGATNQDLPKLADDGNFRHDLLDRLSFDVVTIPPLRYRQDDIGILAEHFALEMIKELQRAYFPGYTEQALDVLHQHTWPGNLRELKNVIERAVYRCPETELVDQIDFDPFASPYRPQQEINNTSETDTPKTSHRDSSVEIIQDFRQHIKEYEITCLLSALKHNKFHKQNTAKSLGLSYNQFRGYLRKYEQELGE